MFVTAEYFNLKISLMCLKFYLVFDHTIYISICSIVSDNVSYTLVYHHHLGIITDMLLMHLKQSSEFDKIFS